MMLSIAEFKWFSQDHTQGMFSGKKMPDDAVDCIYERSRNSQFGGHPRIMAAA